VAYDDIEFSSFIYHMSFMQFPVSWAYACWGLNDGVRGVGFFVAAWHLQEASEDHAVAKGKMENG